MPPLLRLLLVYPKFSLGLGVLLSIFLLSFFHTPDPTSPSFQWPGLLPSRYPPSHHASHPLLNNRLRAGSSLLASICPAPLEPVYIDPGLSIAQEKRYDHLRHSARDPNAHGLKRILVVAALRDVHDQLPDLLNTLIVLVTFLGPARLIFSIVEGPSGDCTANAMEKVIGPTLLAMGVPQHRLHLVTKAQSIDFDSHNRIEVLAGLRNRALSPLWDSKGEDFEAVVMLNDVFLKARDVLELLHQHALTGAGITTGWDWWKRRPGYYYDVWVGRTLDNGDLFYPINGNSWNPSDELFPNSLSSAEAFAKLEPFQVYSSWNGMAILDPRAFLAPHNVRFRRGDQSKRECSASECSLLAEDFWAKGFGRVQVVPSVQLAYDTRAAQETRDDLLASQAKLGWEEGVPPLEEDKHVAWTAQPPARVRCHPWPERNGRDFNVWETTLWVDPLTGVPK